MNIATRSLEDIVIASLSGRLDTQTSGPASEEMSRIASGASKLLLNLEELEFISSAGLRVLLRTAKQLTGSGGTMRLCCANGTVKEVMDIAGFAGLLDLHDSEQDALSAFR